MRTSRAGRTRGGSSQPPLLGVDMSEHGDQLRDLDPSRTHAAGHSGGVSAASAVGETQELRNRFASLYRSHYRHVFAYCRRRVAADQTDDLVAEVFLTVWRRINDAPTGSDVLPWLYRVAHLTTSNHWRGLKRKRNLQRKLDSLVVPTAAPLEDQVLVRTEVREALEVLDSLQHKDQEIIKLSVWEDLSNEEIAMILDLTSEATRQRLHRARKKLASLYQSHTNQMSSPLLRKEVNGEL